MKKMLGMTVIAVMVAGQAALACEDSSPCGFTATTLLAPTWTVYGVISSPFLSTQSALKNDVKMVKGQALEAYETGVASPELLSVVGKVRQEVPEYKQASDEQIISMIALQEEE
ncbi:MAG: hypothetical protein AAGB31_01980 [Bdellovibrio sp.]